MRLSELAKIWNTPVQELMGRAKKSNLRISHDTQLTPEQIAQLKKVEEQSITRPQLPGQSEPQQPQQEPQEQMVQTQNSAPSIAAQTHIQLGKTQEAKNAQADNLFKAAARAEYADGQDAGVLLGLIHKQGEADGYMTVMQAYSDVDRANRGIQSANRANFLADQDNGLLGELQNPCKSYSESEEALATAQSTATAIQSDLSQILKNLRDKS
ncbi:hypothetical protein [Microcoleus sp. MON2_D5]|uniref:hypothetical protein n=1 Tax=Microcoleus sp. MON2_D5 TaxID=2818833 RepID=UPI002FD526D3